MNVPVNPATTAVTSAAIATARLAEEDLRESESSRPLPTGSHHSSSTPRQQPPRRNPHGPAIYLALIAFCLVAAGLIAIVLGAG